MSFLVVLKFKVVIKYRKIVVTRFSNAIPHTCVHEWIDYYTESICARPSKDTWQRLEEFFV